MTLDQYLEVEGITAAQFASRCDPPLSGASISRIRRGGQIPSGKAMVNIIAASQGKVTADALLGRLAA